MSIEVIQRPLITFFVCAYTQRDLVHEAIAGAFAQTYSPLEIILSDDCSPDNTFGVMERMAGVYRGPHHIILNRNTRNRGISGHVNIVASRASGEFLVGSAGDDVSRPDRVERLFEKCWANFPDTASVYSGMQEMDGFGQLLKSPAICMTPRHSENIVEAMRRIRVGVPGCTHAFRKDLFGVFGPLPMEVVIEDEALAFRSLMLGGIRHVPESLVDYRRHENNISGRSDERWKPARVREEYRRRAIRDKAVFESWLRDIEIARSRNLLSESELSEAEVGIYSHLKYLELELRLVAMSAPRALTEAIMVAVCAPNRRPALRAFVRTHVPMSLRKFRKRLFHGDEGTGPPS